MSMRSALTVAVAVGFSLWGCSDEKAGPGVGPETSWRISCGADPGMVCGTDQDPHGPLDGNDEDDKLDDFKFTVKCERASSGLSITITDEGRERNVEKQQLARARSILSISRGDPENNECIVSVTEYPNSGSPKQLKVIENCEGNSASPGTCQFEGEFDSNGYAFEGSLRCDGMRANNSGQPGWVLTDARSDDAITLQIANCN